MPDKLRNDYRKLYDKYENIYLKIRHIKMREASRVGPK